MAITFGSLFAGIGGIDLGFERAGLSCTWQVEIDDYATRVLEYHWPSVRRHGDICTFPPDSGCELLEGRESPGSDNRPGASSWGDQLSSDSSCASSSRQQQHGGSSSSGSEPVRLGDGDNNGRSRSLSSDSSRPEFQSGSAGGGIRQGDPEQHPWYADIIVGGFPCQDLSIAGLGAGLAGERSGLFFELIRVARELRPVALVLENVPALLSRGMDAVLRSLAEIGYDAEWHCIPCAALGAPHIRDRIFIFAYSNRYRGGLRWRECERLVGSFSDFEVQSIGAGPCTIGQGGFGGGRPGDDGCQADVADSECSCEGSARRQSGGGSVGGRVFSDVGERGDLGGDFTDSSCGEDARKGSAERRVGDLVNGVPAGLDGHWNQEPADTPRVTVGEKDRVKKLRGLGNAVVPQVAEYVARLLLEGFQTFGRIESKR